MFVLCLRCIVVEKDWCKSTVLGKKKNRRIYGDAENRQVGIDKDDMKIKEGKRR